MKKETKSKEQEIMKFKERIADLIDLEMEKCPQRKGECFINEILGEIDDFVKSQTTQAAQEAYDCGLDDRDFTAVIKQTEEQGYQRGLKETCISIDEKMAKELLKEGGKTKDVLQTIITQAKNEVVEEIEYRMNTVMIMVHNRNTEKEIKHYLDQVLEQLKK